MENAIATRTDEQLVNDANALAREFYAAHGNIASKGFRFDRSRHPQEQLMWRLACIAWERITGTPVEDALAD